MVLEKEENILKKVLDFRNPAFMYCRIMLGCSQPYAYMLKISSWHHSLVQ